VYYHLAPDSQRLVWDHLPMTLVFMSLLSWTIGERVSLRLGMWLLSPPSGLGSTEVHLTSPGVALGTAA
jgi:hypothetical protein